VMNKILERIQREAGGVDLLEILGEQLTPSDLQSLLLEVYRRRAGRMQPAQVLAQYEANRFVRPAAIAPERLLEWEMAAFSHLPPGFDAVELSPVCPLGTNSAVARVDQNWAVATSRNTEVVSDTTNVLSLECAARRRALLRANPRSSEAIQLAASQRLLRAQAFQNPSQVAHFSLFALCSAGKDQEGNSFESETIAIHVQFYLKVLRIYLGESVPLHVLSTNLRQPSRDSDLEISLHKPLRQEFPDVAFGFDDQRIAGRGYYRTLCFHVYATNPKGQRLELVDGGCVDWAQKYLGNSRERLVSSGIGSERVCALKEEMQ